MAEVEAKNQQVELETPCEPPPGPEPIETSTSMTEEKAVVTVAAEDEKPDDSKALVVVEKAPEPVEKNVLEGSVNRDVVLERVATEKRLALIRAWEESEKCKAENKAQKKLAGVGSWENSKKATLEADLKKIEEKLEKKKAEYVEKLKNKLAAIHKAAEEKKALIEAKRGEDLLKAEELAAKYRATRTGPKKILGIF